MMGSNYLALFISTLCLVHSCSSAVIDNNVVTRNKTNLANLNWDVHLSIFEHLNLLELISLAKTNRHFSMLAEEVFRVKYGKAEIKFSDVIYTGYIDPIIETGAIVFIRDINILLNTLRYFGPTLTNLEVEYLHSKSKDLSDDFAQISSYIKSYCSANITIRFNIDCAPNDQHSRKNIHTSRATIDEVLPVLRVAQLKTVEHNISRMGELPLLEQVDVHILPTTLNERFKRADIEELLRRNPQIRSLRLRSCSPSLLKTVNEILPNLETLEVQHYIDELNFDHDHPIVFANLKIFKLDIAAADTVFKIIRLDKLVEFIGNDAFGPHNHWINFVVNCSTLQKLQVQLLTDESGQAELFASKSSNLTDVFFRFISRANVDNVIDFINNNKKLERIQMTFMDVNLCERVFEELTKLISDQWTITSVTLYINLKSKL